MALEMSLGVRREVGKLGLATVPEEELEEHPAAFLRLLKVVDKPVDALFERIDEGRVDHGGLDRLFARATPATPLRIPHASLRFEGGGAGREERFSPQRDRSVPLCSAWISLDGVESDKRRQAEIRRLRVQG